MVIKGVGTQKGYAVVSAPLPDSTFCSYLFTKEHKEGTGKGRTLFVVNIDDDGGRLFGSELKKQIIDQWKTCGKIENVKIVNENSSAEWNNGSIDILNSDCQPMKSVEPLSRKPASAHIRFQEAKSLQRALAVRKLKKIEKKSDFGINLSMQRHRAMRPDQNMLRKKVDEFIQNYDEKDLQNRKMLEEEANKVDDQGWTTIPQSGRKRAQDSTFQLQPARKKKKKPVELQDFYRFQMREEKRDQLAVLREKFEKDKEKIAKLKASRKFKPF